jgi:formiminotetrahydrofolate cyclodeaminase
MQHGLQVAVEVPLETARVSLRAMHAAWATGQHGNPKSLTDAAVGVQMGFAGVCGGVWNAWINLADIRDPAYVVRVRAECEELLAGAKTLSLQCETWVRDRIGG